MKVQIINQKKYEGTSKTTNKPYAFTVYDAVLHNSDGLTIGSFTIYGDHKEVKNNTAQDLIFQARKDKENKTSFIPVGFKE